MYLSAEKLRSGALLAPMAGVADRAMRELCMGFGAIGCIGEMASSKGISMNDRKTSELLSLSEAERPAGVQIFGDVPEIMAKSIETCIKYSPDFIDINMGCPAPKVAGNGGGIGRALRAGRRCGDNRARQDAQADVCAACRPRGYSRG